MTDISGAQLADLRRRVLNHEEVSPEEYRAVAESIRASRKAEAARARATKSSASKQPSVDTQKLLDEFI